MTILLKNHIFDAEVVDIMTTAYEDVLSTLPLSDCDNRQLANSIATRIAELVITGERDPQRIRDQIPRSLDHDLREGS